MPTTGPDTGPRVPVRAAGDRAFLLAPDHPDRIPYLVERLTGQRPPGLTDVLPAAETVLVTVDSAAAAARMRPVLEHLVAAADAADPSDVSRGTSPETSEPVRIPVHYDGPDLDEVARALALPVDEVIAAHTGTTWYCAFVGFAPGFGYLTAPNTRLRVG
ncbi:carboxyltransferase domain-containing protein, partial [Nocardia sp. NPDC003345]